MKKDLYFPSAGRGIIHAVRWEPVGTVKGIVQIIHGIAEHTKRYQEFAEYLNAAGYLVVAEDHMGHGRSGGKACIRGYFYGGWFKAVDDCYQLLESTKAEFPDVPYYIFGHSMGSFMARTLLIKHPNTGIKGAIICGTGWMSEAVLKSGYTIAKMICNKNSEKKHSPTLHKLMFGSYNKKVEHPRTEFDWLTRDGTVVDAYIADPMCGFPETAGLARDMLEGIIYIQKSTNMKDMNISTPIFFIAGGADPVGSYGKGVRKAADKFKQIGMRYISCKIYPLCRHELLNEINRQEIYQDIGQWLEKNRKAGH